MGTEQPARWSWLTGGWAGFVLALLVGAATYAVWLAWDNENYYDAALGAYQGPYRPMQVVGCGLMFVVVTALLALRWPPLAVAAGSTVGFWLFWTIQAGSRDETGLFLVGSILLFPVLVAGSGLAGGIGFVLRRRWRRTTRSRQSGTGDWR